MLARVRALAPRALPQGWIDVVRQVAIFGALYYGYRIVRGAIDGHTTAAAFEHARDIIGIERSLHLFIEPAVQAWGTSTGWVSTIASWLYVNAHLPLMIGTLIWVYLFRNRSYYFVRNVFVLSMGIALVGYIVFPTAPPRLFPEWGFTDSVSDFLGVNTDTSAASALVNPFAAVPSMHVCFSLIIGITLARLVRPRALKVAWALYPVLMTSVVLITANHWWMDAALGALTALVSATIAHALLARARPDDWAFAGAAAG
jgi:PAP2 superfamily